MKKKITVLGSGLVGSAMIRDLISTGEFALVAIDKDQQRLESLGRHPDLEVRNADLQAEPYPSIHFSDAAIILNAVPGHMGNRMVEKALLAGKDVVDIAFSPEDPRDLHLTALENGATLITDMGVAPGMSHVLAGHAASIMDEVEELVIMVGGLPVERTWPWEYKAVFSPADVLEEYTRPARFVRDGQIISKPALSEQELVQFDPVGTLEAFNSDGLRSLLFSIPVKNMVEKTLRYPGHARLMEVLRHSGFLNPAPLDPANSLISPLSLTSTLLFQQWKLEPGEQDITMMRVTARGFKSGQSISYRADLYDTYDPIKGIHSMARTTGYAATSAVRLLSNDPSLPKGLILPEHLGQHPEWRAFLLADQARHGINYDISIG